MSPEQKCVIRLDRRRSCRRAPPGSDSLEPEDETFVIGLVALWLRAIERGETRDQFVGIHEEIQKALLGQKPGGIHRRVDPGRHGLHGQPIPPAAQEGGPIHDDVVERLPDQIRQHVIRLRQVLKDGRKQQHVRPFDVHTAFDGFVESQLVVRELLLPARDMLALLDDAPAHALEEGHQRFGIEVHASERTAEIKNTQLTTVVGRGTQEAGEEGKRVVDRRECHGVALVRGFAIPDSQQGGARLRQDHGRGISR